MRLTVVEVDNQVRLEDREVIEIERQNSVEIEDDNEIKLEGQKGADVHGGFHHFRLCRQA